MAMAMTNEAKAPMHNGLSFRKQASMQVGSAPNQGSMHGAALRAVTSFEDLVP